MAKTRYNNAFKSGIVTILLCCLLFGGIFTAGVISEIQYKEFTQGMLTTNATITDIKIDRHSSKYGGYDQEMQITYTVNGKRYDRELATDTKMAFQAGYRTHFSEGDVVEIFYNPEDPMEIATELSSKHAVKMMIFSGVCLVLFIAILVSGIVTRKRFVITEQEYSSEKRKKKAKRKLYKSTKGYKIRTQYFNFLLLAELCVFIAVIAILALNTLLDGSGTKLKSFAEVISLFFVFVVLISPIWILSLINRRFFGKIVCILTDSGIKYGDETIKWEDITEIVYEVNPSMSLGSSAKGSCSYARVIGGEIDIQINKAPLMIVKKAKKYKKEINAHMSKRSLLNLIFIPVGVVIIIMIPFLIALIP